MGVSFELRNESRQVWKPGEFFAAYQLFDPDTGLFIREGAWEDLAQETSPGATHAFVLQIDFPAADGRYLIYVSALAQGRWAYDRGERFLAIHAEVRGRELP